ncbi:DNA mismatch repair protein MutS [bacterium]|nr:DNA mismatch repair protein MutS [bacterium]
MAQYLSVKSNHPDSLVFFRMGDFYELFFDDARIAASALDITLTHRGQLGDQPIPMAGVPHHAAETYLARLIKLGHRVAVCEQMEDPAAARKRGSKSIVRREVVRVVTPGTITEASLLDARSACWLAAVGFAAGGREAAVAAADVSTGRLEVFAVERAGLREALTALSPREALIAEGQAGEEDVLTSLSEAAITLRPNAKADPRHGERLTREVYGVASLEGFGGFSRAELSALALLFDYLSFTQAGVTARLDTPLRRAPGATLAIDPATRASLEIERTQGGAREGSLLAAIDRTLTGGGARLLAERLSRPLCDRTEIERRLDAVEVFVGDARLREAVRADLRSCPDVERARTRLALGRGAPRDLVLVADALRRGERMAGHMIAADVAGASGALSEIAVSASALSLFEAPALATLIDEIERAILPDSQAQPREGGFVQPGFDPSLDEVRSLRDGARRVIAELQARYADSTGVPGLRIKHNNVLGYFVEVSPRHADAVTGRMDDLFRHRQTLAGAVRFSTDELADLDARIARADEEAAARELEIFQRLATGVEAQSAAISMAAAAIARIDVASALAEWSQEAGCVRPVFADETVLELEAGRHPVVEAALRRGGGGFTANDCSLDGSGAAGPRLALVTGPNMAGKSTYLRQAALLVVLAQAGAFVPARRMRLGLADRLFSRVGASDDLARGRSTFMVEMTETAAILNQATPRSFVILDEVGRGTSTWDGLAIAWAAVEHLHDVNRCRALFATHYHELTALVDGLPNAANLSVQAREWKGELVFLHEVRAGPADKSYGVQVARLAGLPPAAVRRAEAVLKRLEARSGAKPDDLPLFAAAARAAPDPGAVSFREDGSAAPPAPSAVETILTGVTVDDLTPREALDLIYQLKLALNPPSS